VHNAIPVCIICLHTYVIPRTTRLCVAQAWDVYRGVLRLVDCTYSDPNTFFIAAEVNNFSQIVDKATGKCISMEENVLEPGAVLKLKTCKDPEGAEKLTSQSFVVVRERIFLCMYIYVCVYVCIYVCMYVCMHVPSMQMS
jgi:hypothetical protein